MNRRIFLGKRLNLPEFVFVKSTVYYGEKIEMLLEKYPLLNKVLVPISGGFDNSSVYYDSIVDEINKSLECDK